MNRIRRLVLPGLLAAAAYWAVFGGEFSVFELSEIRGTLVAEETRLADVQTRIDSLTVWRDLLTDDPATIERVAREDFGMIREGETLYRFVDPEVDEDVGPER
ncbi:MAG: septum formation initiator family protein [Gemmatimonadota bacterium]